ncbi:MAG: hypothetical protein HDT25_06125 [Ruminococcus sp.]|nr:hypothetical protein [Ruminococcus sp.]
MSKKLKYIFGAILSLLVLGGCKEEMPSLGEASTAETTSETVTETSSAVTTAVPAKAETETSTAASEKSENNRAEEKSALMRLVQNAASEGEDRTFDIFNNLFRDFDGDGRYELIAECGGYYWYTDGEKTETLMDSLFFDMKLGLMLADGQNIITLSTSDNQYTYLYTVKNGELTELEASGKFGSITGSGKGDGVFTAVSHDYDNCINENREHTWKPYWLYFEDGEFKEYVGKKISKADFMKYTGGNAALDQIEADGGTVTDILYRENDIVNINYTVTRNDTEYNKFYIYDVSGGNCKEVKALFENRENDYGVYLPSALKPSDEQLDLHELIETTSDSNSWDKVIAPLFGDFDGDGKNELIAEYGGPTGSELWFASGDKAYKLEERVNSDYTMGGRGAPCILSSAGNVYFMVQHYYAGTLGGTRGSCRYYLIKNSTACEIGGETEQNLVPDGDYGDLISDSMAYDGFFDKEYGHIMGQSWKNYWFYFLGEEIRQYYGTEITREEFLKYEGAAAILDKIAADGKEVTEILKRGNGTVTVNIKDEDDKGIGFGYVTSKYRHGKLFVVKDDGYGDYWDKWGESQYIEYEPTTDFERFSEMIYDTAEGDENSFIRERFYGDTDKDGKNELYAYYGTDENFSLWFADDSGAKKVTEDISLFYADGDVLMKNGDDYFVMKNGKQKKLDTMGAEDFSVQADGSFTGYITSGYSDSTRSDVIRQLYWFRYKDGKISEYTGLDITEEEFLQYVGGRAFLDEVAARGGDLVNIVRRENGIININYALHNQTVTNRFFMTLEIGADNKLTDITPKNEDGTPDNAGWYLHSLSIASSK